MMDGNPASSTSASASSSDAGQAAGRHLDADLLHRVAEQQAILGHLDRVDLRADQLDAVRLEHAARRSATARFSAVCPPTVGSIASGRSFSMMAATISTVSGSM